MDTKEGNPLLCFQHRGLSWSVCSSRHTQGAFIIHKLRGPWWAGAAHSQGRAGRLGSWGCGECWRLDLGSAGLSSHSCFSGVVGNPQRRPQAGCQGVARGERKWGKDVFPLETALSLVWKMCFKFPFRLWNEIAKQNISLENRGEKNHHHSEHFSVITYTLVYSLHFFIGIFLCMLEYPWFCILLF